MNAEAVESQVISWVKEAIELRHGAAGDNEGPLKQVSLDDGPHAVTYELTRVRTRVDRVDFLRTQVSLVRIKLRKARAEAKFQADSKLMEATSARNKTKVEFTSADAIRADAGLDSFEERRAAHEAQVLADVVEDSFRIIDKIAFELDSIRNDLRAIIKSLQFESTLDH